MAISKKIQKLFGELIDETKTEKVIGAIKGLTDAEKAELSVTVDGNINSLFSRAVSRGNAELAQQLLDNGITVSDRSYGSVKDEKMLDDMIKEAEASQNELMLTALSKAKAERTNNDLQQVDAPAGTAGLGANVSAAAAGAIPVGGNVNAPGMAGALARADGDKGGTITFGPGGSQEFEKLVAQMGGIENFLKSGDMNGDGITATNELQAALEGSGLNMNIRDASGKQINVMAEFKRAIQMSGGKMDASGNFTLTGAGAPTPNTTGAAPAQTGPSKYNGI